MMMRPIIAFLLYLRGGFGFGAGFDLGFLEDMA